jgi:lauroyl/myristoyl acyltransferase
MREVMLGWKPGLSLIGTDHIEAALARGRGAVLWVAHFSFNALATKKALSDAGYRVYHISRPEHGFSKTLFGIHVLNWIRIRAEKPYLAGRIVIDRNRPAECMYEAMKLLRQNLLVSITSGAWEGEKVVAAEIFGAELEIAAGAPRLAYSSGSILLPVFTIRRGKAIDVVIEDPLELQGLSRDEYVKAATATFVKQTGKIASLYPEQWRDWEKLKPLRNLQAAQGEAPIVSVEQLPI